MLYRLTKQSKRRFTIVKIVISWILLIAWVGFIYLTLGTVPDWRDTLVENYGEEVFTTISFTGAGIALVILLGIMILYYRQKKILPYVSLLIVLGFLAHVMLNWIRLPVEQIHFIEYGMVGFLAYNALRHHLRGWGLITSVIVLTFLLGMFDEYIQGILVNRVGEQRDMYWNGLAGVIAAAIVALSLRPGILLIRSGRWELRAHLVMAAICLIIQGTFNTNISQFGYLHHDPEMNLTFKSRLNLEDLRAYNDNLDHFKTEIAPRIGRERMVHLLQKVHDLIHEEALVHCFRRGYHFRKGNIRTVYSEDLIIDKYYRQFVEGTDLDWKRSLSSAMRPVVGKRFEILYHSIVANHLITSYRGWQMWLLIGILEGIIIILFILSFREKKPKSP